MSGSGWSGAEGVTSDRWFAACAARAELRLRSLPVEKIGAAGLLLLKALDAPIRVAESEPVSRPNLSSVSSGSSRSDMGPPQSPLMFPVEM